MAARKNSTSSSNTQLIEELEALSQSLYQSHTTTTTARRTASLALPRTSLPSFVPTDEAAPKGGERSGSQTRSRRMSLSPWRSRPKPDDDRDAKGKDPPVKAIGPGLAESKKFDDKSGDKKGIWNWKPMRVLAHIGMQKLSCLFSVEVVSVQGLPASMNGLRLSVCVRKKESKDGAVQTMPSRVSQGAADFEETLFVKCHVYCAPGAGKQLKFEPRPFVIYVFAVDADELDFGKSSVDISQLIQESMEKNVEGTRIRQWDVSFGLSGKAKGGELVLKLGFQIMEKDGGIGIYSQGEGSKVDKTKTFSSSSFGRKQSKSSFSIPSPRLQSRSEACTPSQLGSIADIQGMDDLNLDEPAPAASETSVEKSEEPDSKAEDMDLPDFEVVDKGVEIQDREEESVATEVIGDGDEKSGSATSEVVKEVVVQDPSQFSRLTELDSIAQQIKALESMIADEKVIKIEDQPESQGLDAEEESVTWEFLQMLEGEEGTIEYGKSAALDIPPLQLEGPENPSEAEHETEVFVPDLGKGLGCVVQTRNGGYLAAINPLDAKVTRKDTPKLALQISRPVVLVLPKVSFPSNGFELFQRMAVLGIEDLSAKLSTLMPLEELLGKTAEQIAFEGIASTIIQGRNKEGASSSAARILSTVKNMAAAMNSGRRDRISTGLWNMPEEPLTADEILTSSLQKLESMSIEGLKIQAGMAEEDSPFDVSPTLIGDHPLSSTIPLEGWTPPSEPSPVVLVAMIQLRDPLRRYEAVGGPMLAVIMAAGAEPASKSGKEDNEMKYKVTSLHVGGVTAGGGGGKKSARDGERQRLTAMQWLVSYGVGKQVKKGKVSAAAAKGKELLWSLSSRVMADMWLKPMRNPDVKFSKS